MKLTKTDIELAIAAIAAQPQFFSSSVARLEKAESTGSEYGKFIVAVAKQINESMEKFDPPI